MRRIMTSLIRISINIIVLLILAAIPLGFSNMDGRVNVNISIMFANINSFFQGLFSGDSWYYYQGDRVRFIISDLFSFFISSYLYMIVASFLVVILSIILGIFFWKKSSKWLDASLGILGVIPDFLLVLLLQLSVVYINKNFGVSTFKVASSSVSDPAIFLPLFTLVLVPLFYLVKSLSDVTFDVSTENYVLTAKSKGLSKFYIYVYYVSLNVFPYLKADLFKVTSILIGNLFIVEYLYNTRGLTSILFQYQVHFGYQYNLVVMCLLSFFILYLACYFTIWLFIVTVERCISK